MPQGPGVWARGLFSPPGVVFNRSVSQRQTVLHAAAKKVLPIHSITNRIRSIIPMIRIINKTIGIIRRIPNNNEIPIIVQNK